MNINFRVLNRISVKIFLGFWLVTILMLLGSNLVIHFFNIGPDKHFSGQDKDGFYGPGDRLLREVVSDAVNYDYQQVRAGLSTMPHSVTKNFYLINNAGEDLLYRDIPAKIKALLPNITEKNPLFKTQVGDTHYYGRLFQLNDGTELRLVVNSPKNNHMDWRLFFGNFWHILLLDILISGAACFYLAHYITRDIQVLKNATQRIAKGDWNTSVGKELRDRPGEISQLGEAFDNMASKLQQSMQEQKRLIKDVSHELRSPLARLQVALAIAQQRANSEITEELDRIKKAADYLNDVISEILSMPIAEQEEWELTDVVDMRSLIEGVAQYYEEEEAHAKQVCIKLKHLPEEVLVATRGATLVGVFDNILRNAVRYTSDHSKVTINFSIIKQKHAEQLRIRVEDNGPGVAQEHLDSIFEPFFRTDEARDRQSGGYGLGLAIAKRTVLHHGGSITAENLNRGGLAITVTLPVVSSYDDK